MEQEQVLPWMQGLKLVVKRGYHSSTSCYYFGLPELGSMGFLLHFLRPADVFFDVGANIGAYSLLASGITGANSIAFEPAPLAAALFAKNTALNQLSGKVQLHQIGLGVAHQTIEFTTGKGIQNHISNTGDPQSTTIQLAPLDDFGKSDPPILLKLDVEGYETAVVAGGSATLSSPTTRALIVEQMGLGQRFGFDEEELHQRLVGLGFELFDYHPFSRKLERIKNPLFGNNLYLRDPGFVEKRLTAAAQITVHGRSF